MKHKNSAEPTVTIETRVDADESAVWEAAVDAQTSGPDDETLELPVARDEPDDLDADDFDPGDTIGRRSLKAFETGNG